MARFRGKRESKAPAMRPVTVRRHSEDVDALENELLDGPSDTGTDEMPSDMAVADDVGSSEPDSTAEVTTTPHNSTVIPTRPNTTVEPVEKTIDAPTPKVSVRTGSGPITGNVTNEVIPIQVATVEKAKPSQTPAHVAVKTPTERMDTSDAGVAVPNDARTGGKDANDSHDSGNGNDEDDIPGLYAAVAMIEEQTRSNFPKTARPPGLVDCSTVSTG